MPAPPVSLPIEEILSRPEPSGASSGLRIGTSRQGRAVFGHVLGRGPVHLSLIAGCHADEPVGPAMLVKLVEYLAAQPANAAALRELTWYIVPHANPDGAARNASWTGTTRAAVDHLGEADRIYHLAHCLRDQVREPPGDDMEFGFPRGSDDHDARPENRAVADFLTAGAPLTLHGSFHGMSFASGPWFLIEPAWIDRTVRLREALRRRVRSMGYRPLDVDRRGDKGFRRIDEGFSTRPDSIAMAAHFREQGDAETAAKFRPSSMEFVRRLGGDPLTLVSEMPLFLLPSEPRPGGPPEQPGSAGRRTLQRWLEQLAGGGDPDRLVAAAEAGGVRGMPIRDQMRLQLAFLNEALAAVSL